MCSTAERSVLLLLLPTHQLKYFYILSEFFWLTRCHPSQCIPQNIHSAIRPPKLFFKFNVRWLKYTNETPCCIWKCFDIITSYRNSALGFLQKNVIRVIHESGIRQCFWKGNVTIYLDSIISMPRNIYHILEMWLYQDICTMKIVEMNHFIIKIKSIDETCVVSEVGEFLFIFSFFLLQNEHNPLCAK